MPPLSTPHGIIVRKKKHGCGCSGSVQAVAAAVATAAFTKH